MSNLDHEELPPRRIDGRVVIAKVAEYYNISIKRVVGVGRSKWVVQPRQIAMWICRNVLVMSFPDVGRMFERDHSTVMQACDRISAQLRTDREFADELDRIVRFIDPRHRILESTYSYTFNDGDIEQLVESARHILELARSKRICTIAVTYKLLRGSASVKPPGLDPRREASSEDQGDPDNDRHEVEPR